MPTTLKRKRPPYGRLKGDRTKRPKTTVYAGKAGFRAKTAGGSVKKRTSASRSPASRRSGGTKLSRGRRLPYRRRNKKISGAVGSRPLSATDASFSYARFGSGTRVYPGFRSRGQQLSFSSLLPLRLSSVAGQQETYCLPSFRARTQATSGTAIGTSGLDFQGNEIGVGAVLAQYCRTELQRTIANSPFTYVTNQVGTNEQPGVRTAKFVINYLKLQHEFKATGSTPTHLTLYEIQLRPGGHRTSSSGNPTSTWMHPNDAWELGLADKRAQTADADICLASAARRVPYQKPFDSHFFCRQYRVYKTTRLILHPGQTHIHSVTIRPRNMFSLYPSDAVTGTRESIDHYWGQETMTVAVIMGTPVHDKGTSNVTVMSTSLDLVTKATCSYQLFDKSSRNWHEFSYLAAGPFTQLRSTEEDTGMPTDLPAEA